MFDKSGIINSICNALSSSGVMAAADISRKRYPWIAHPHAARTFTETQALRIFLRDGFVDRYSGNRLVFPPVLRALSLALPKEFPYHKNWKMNETHPAYWELFPTLDHVNPVARGGRNDNDNIVSTSMLRNAAKAYWTLEELGWSLHQPGDLGQWDGMLAWFLNYADQNKRILGNGYIKRWYLAAKSVKANAAQPLRGKDD